MAFDLQSRIHLLKWILMIINGMFAAFNFFVMVMLLASSAFIDIIEEHVKATDPKIEEADINAEVQMVLIFLEILGGLSLLFSILGFYAAYKEHRCLLITYGVFFALCAISLLFYSFTGSAFYAILAGCAFGLYFMVRNKARSAGSPKV